VEDPVTWLKSEIHRTGATLVIIDTLGRFIGVKDLNDYAEVTRRTEPLLGLARDTGAHLHLIHHAKKGDPTTDAIDSSLGSTAITALADTVIVSRRRRDGLRTVETIQRTGVDLPATIVVMDRETGRLTLDVEVEQHKRTAVEDQIEEVLRANGPLSQDQLREMIGGDRRLTAEAFAAMRKAERVVKLSGAGKKGAPFRFALADKSKQESRHSIKAGKQNGGHTAASSFGSRFPAFLLGDPMDDVSVTDTMQVSVVHRPIDGEPPELDVDLWALDSALREPGVEG